MSLLLLSPFQTQSLLNLKWISTGNSTCAALLCTFWIMNGCSDMHECSHDLNLNNKLWIKIKAEARLAVLANWEQLPWSPGGLCRFAQWSLPAALLAYEWHLSLYELLVQLIPSEISSDEQGLQLCTSERPWPFTAQWSSYSNALKLLEKLPHNRWCSVWGHWKAVGNTLNPPCSALPKWLLLNKHSLVPEIPNYHRN